MPPNWLHRLVRQIDEQIQQQLDRPWAGTHPVWLDIPKVFDLSGLDDLETRANLIAAFQHRNIRITINHHKADGYAIGWSYT